MVRRALFCLLIFDMVSTCQAGSLTLSFFDKNPCTQRSIA